MPQVSDALRSVWAAIQHPQCGRTMPQAVADTRPFADRRALAILLAVPNHPEASVEHKQDAATLLATWQQKCGHWKLDPLNAHNASPELPSGYREWQPYLDIALKSADH
ncbi:hypothetical protein [Paraburkholderia phenazinium]|nr:hypothetical protein [Paraburkholderia phenazinium]